MSVNKVISVLLSLPDHWRLREAVGRSQKIVWTCIQTAPIEVCISRPDMSEQVRAAFPIPVIPPNEERDSAGLI